MRKVLAVVAVAAFALGACGGDEEGGDGGETETTGAECEDLTGSPTFTITIADNSFSPACAIAERSQGLTLTNEGGNNHTFTIDGTQVDVEVPGGETANLEAINDALAAGTYTVYCRFHGNPDGSGMSMELTAQ
jgi:plastocyanin